MPTDSQLILPPRDLAGCVAACILRDTRAATLSDAQRISYFPASPLYAITLTLQGQLHVSDRLVGVEDLRDTPPCGKWLIQTPKDTPSCSWAPGPVHAMTLGFFPDAWQRLGGTQDGPPPACLAPALTAWEAAMPARDWPLFWRELSAVWAQVGGADWRGSHLLSDWTRHLSLRLAQSGSGRSLRSAQRRLQRWTGQTQKTLNMFAKIEELHRLSLEAPDATPAQIAADAGFSDQSHMGRSLKRLTGFSPAYLNERLAQDEAFWCYRLLGERF